MTGQILHNNKTFIPGGLSSIPDKPWKWDYTEVATTKDTKNRKEWLTQKIANTLHGYKGQSYNKSCFVPWCLCGKSKIWDKNVWYDRRTTPPGLSFLPGSSIPTGLCILAQGCSTAATLGNDTTKPLPHRGCVNKMNQMGTVQ